MRKIPTIFDRDWEGDRKVIDKPFDHFDFDHSKATEKLDGTNIRLTIRNEEVVRVEKRRNPSKVQKAEGITDPWYVDADENAPEDKHIFSSVKARGYREIQDGVWSGEAIGPGIQGNPLGLQENTVCLFSRGEAPVLSDVPIDFKELQEWLKSQLSQFPSALGMIEGIVWHWPDGGMAKIKAKDFR